MVNTFVTSRSLRKSAKQLDNKRLGKQRVEAKQLLDNCMKIKHWKNYYNVHIPDWDYTTTDTIQSGIKLLNRMVRQDIKNNIIHFYDSLEDEWIILDKMPVKKLGCSKTPTWFVKDNTVYIQTPDWVKYSRYDVKLPNDIIGTAGHLCHPALRMWIGYEDALKYYINVHILEWISRGYNNNMKIHNTPTSVVYPSWINKDNIKIHKAMLMQKELQRNEFPFYINFETFVSSYQELTRDGVEILDWTWY